MKQKNRGDERLQKMEKKEQKRCEIIEERCDKNKIGIEKIR